jgi:prolipoprotein diacylglyceryltransferase
MTGLHPWWPAGVPIHPHLLFELLAWLGGILVLAGSRRDSTDPWIRIQLATAAVVGGAVGAKVLFWLIDPGSWWPSTAEPTAWIGGKTVVGGLLGAQAAVELTKRALRVDRSTGDAYVLPLTVGMILGRCGCFFSGTTDGTHGGRVPWGMDLGDGVPRHPTALYEIVALVLLFAATRLWGDRGLPGDRFALWMAGYLMFRLMIEPLKGQPVWIGVGLSSIQIACVLGLLAYTLALPRRIRRGRAPEAPR